MSRLKFFSKSNRDALICSIINCATAVGVFAYVCATISVMLKLISWPIPLKIGSLDEQKNYLRNCAVNLQNNTMGYLKGHHEKLIRISELFKSQPAVFLKDQNRMIKDRNDLLARVLKLRFDNDKKKLTNYTKIVDILHPANTMKRGFSITRSKEGKVIRTVKAIKTHEEITTEVYDGCLVSEVKALKQGGKG